MSDSELLKQIASLAGAINRHKNSANGNANGVAGRPSSTSRQYPYPYSTRGSDRGHYRGRSSSYRGSNVTHRNRSLVLSRPVEPNNQNSEKINGDEDNLEASFSSSSGRQGEESQRFVKKRDRHMQLINTAVYADLAQARAKAMEATRREKEERKKARREAIRARKVAANMDEVEIDGVKYAVKQGGNKLIRMTENNMGSSEDSNPGTKKAVIGGVTFLRSKTGNFWRKGVVQKSLKRQRSIQEPCRYFTMTGKCSKGLSCPYQHDPERVALCPRYLHGKCDNESCDLSHNASAHNAPLCVHFLRGNCSNRQCKYTHMRPPPGAKVCRDFALLGYCEKGLDCKQRHVWECPDFDETGTCPRGEKKCKLTHIRRAGKQRDNDESNMKDVGDFMIFTEDSEADVSELPSDVMETLTARMAHEDDNEDNSTEEDNIKDEDLSDEGVEEGSVSEEIDDNEEEFDSDIVSGDDTDELDGQHEYIRL
ncbi:hypothetical protein V1511DRAFT_110831 [Dipodascopsis uninucleata]